MPNTVKRSPPLFRLSDSGKQKENVLFFWACFNGGVPDVEHPPMLFAIENAPLHTKSWFLRL